MQRILDETNRYYLQNRAGECEYTSNWQNMPSIEMDKFLVITILTELFDKYWSIAVYTYFWSIFIRNRHQGIIYYMHFVNNYYISDSDRFEKTKRIIYDFKRQFTNCISPIQNLCIDESLMLWKGDLDSSRVLHRCGVKLYSSSTSSFT